MPGARDSKGRFLPAGSSGGEDDGGSAAEGLAAMTEGMTAASSAASNLSAIMERQRATMAAYASAASDAAARERDLARSMAESQKLMKQRDDAAAKLKEQQQTAKSTSEAFANLSQNSSQWSESLAGASEQLINIWNMAAPVVAVLAVVAGAFAQLAAAAIQFTQEKDALRATFDVFTGGGGQAMLDGLEALAAQLPFTADKLNGWAKSLLAAGISGKAMETAVRAVAAATAIMGESGGAAAEGLIKRFAMMAETGQKVKLDRRILSQLAAAGVSVQALADALGVPADKLGTMAIAADKLGVAMQNALINKGAKALSVMGDSWASISAKLNEGWQDLFEDMGDIVGPFMAQLRSLASEFFAGSTAGTLMKDKLKSVLAPAFEVATRTVRAMHIAMLEVEIAYLKASIAMRPITSVLDKIGVSGGIVNVAMYLIAGTAVTLAVVFGVLALAAGLVALPFIVFGLAIYGVVQAIGYLYDKLAAAEGKIAAFKASFSLGDVLTGIRNFATDAEDALIDMATGAVTAGVNFVIGLAQALLTGKGPVAAAAKALAMSALNAVTGIFKTASPSKATKEIGGHVAAGLAIGMGDGADDVEDAGADLGTAGLGGVRKGIAKAPRSKGDGKSGPTFIFDRCVFGGDLNQSKVNDMMQSWWERLRAEGPSPEGA